MKWEKGEIIIDKKIFLCDVNQTSENVSNKGFLYMLKEHVTFIYFLKHEEFFNNDLKVVM